MSDSQTYEERVTRLSAARRRISADKRAAVLSALDDLTREDRHVTRRAVIARAGVHRNFLQRHKDLAARIDAAAGAQQASRRRPPADRVTPESLRTELATAKHRNRELNNRVQALERRLSNHGAVLGPSVVENHPIVLDLRARLARCEVELSEKNRAIEALLDDVEILRETNRSLVREYGLTARS
jgi:hypothetical protein